MRYSVKPAAPRAGRAGFLSYRLPIATSVVGGTRTEPVAVSCGIDRMPTAHDVLTTRCGLGRRREPCTRAVGCFRPEHTPMVRGVSSARHIGDEGGAPRWARVAG